jgi:hypothetical protein
MLAFLFRFFGFIAPKALAYFRFWAYQMKIIPETRRAHYIWYLRFYFNMIIIKTMRNGLPKINIKTRFEINIFIKLTELPFLYHEIDKTIKICDRIWFMEKMSEYHCSRCQFLNPSWSAESYNNGYDIDNVITSNIYFVVTCKIRVCVVYL